MKKILLAAMMLVFVSGIASAQRCGRGNGHSIPRPHGCVRPHNSSAAVVYDETSTVLTVQFQSHSRGGLVEVYRDGAKVAGITANAGTTFSCVLREYGEGDYTVIVSNGNTVVYSKNFTVR